MAVGKVRWVARVLKLKSARNEDKQEEIKDEKNCEVLVKNSLGILNKKIHAREERISRVESVNQKLTDGKLLKGSKRGSRSTEG